ncbi:MAG: hypothetical protein P1V35_10390 [Planctomycetota bacterium]|nr:hypothetical protein [Planctomycetota bacterium]
MKKLITPMIAGLCLAGISQAAEVLVNANISTSTTWTANNTYNLQDQIYVLPGATLTIEAGTVIASDTGVGGSLAVTKGAQIFVLGTQQNPVIMTSKADVATWTGGDPKTGTWRESANEWGNLTIMGDAYISENAIAANTAAPSASNYGEMEGLTPSSASDTKTRYGGGNDDDDSGTVQYLSLRYGGKVIGLGNELNGLSLGGVGRGTDLHHVEVMNNVDDGIEVWGGTLNMKYVSVWNVGDDSLDFDQGWRGKLQFGLVVQGYSLDASQGSGVGDNCIEHDGAEDSDWQPVTTTNFYNLTVIGQPVDGDGATAWRDNANVQYHNSIFMDCGEKVVRFDGDDGDGANGYGHNGTLSWADHWTTPYTFTSPVNAAANPSAMYGAQTSGNLCEITDSVFFRNLNGSAYTEANNVGVFDVANDNVLIPGFDAADAPIVSITRDTPVVKGGKTMVRVIGLNPMPANEALTSVGSAPFDGFYTPANYRGAFAPGNNWLNGWSASSAFGIVANDNNVGDSFCMPTANSTGDSALLTGSFGSGVGSGLHLEVSNGVPSGLGYFLVGTGVADGLSISNGQLCLAGPGTQFFRYNVAGGSSNSIGVFNASGVLQNFSSTSTTGFGFDVPTTVPSTIPSTILSGDTWHFQVWYRDTPAGVGTSNFSNGLSVSF